MSWIKKLQERWGLTSLFQVIIILIVFACTGMTSLYVKEALYWIAGITPETTEWIRITYRIFATFIAYQFLLLGYGWVFGQFQFFWAMEKKILRRFGIKIGGDKE
ncbi:MAG: DUF6787 family protein [Bacteroidota bacterium]